MASLREDVARAIMKTHRPSTEWDGLLEKAKWAYLVEADAALAAIGIPTEVLEKMRAGELIAVERKTWDDIHEHGVSTHAE